MHENKYTVKISYLFERLPTDYQLISDEEKIIHEIDHNAMRAVFSNIFDYIPHVKRLLEKKNLLHKSVQEVFTMWNLFSYGQELSKWSRYNDLYMKERRGAYRKWRYVFYF